MVQWAKEFSAAITICDLDGKIVEMNNKSIETFKDDGGNQLIGKSLFSCHSESSSNIIKNLLANNSCNVYTIEKGGIKKLIYQSPWYEEGKIKGLVEISIEIPTEMQHHIR
jgi:transcriptional regulator with PAS, ATPase and Fis domain